MSVLQRQEAHAGFPSGTDNDEFMWKQRITEKLVDLLRFCVRGMLMANGMLLAVGLTYLVAKLIYFFLRYLDRTVFHSAW